MDRSWPDFEIIKVSKGSLRSLRKLIQALTFADTSYAGSHR